MVIKKKQKTYLLIFLIFLVGCIGFFNYYNGGQTPYNYKIKHITDAQNDWEYPDGLINQIDYYSTSEKSSKVIFFGDSHIESFGPRIVNLYKSNLIKEVAFVTDGGCAPIPNSFRSEKHINKCSNLFLKFKKTLENNPIETIILGGSYKSYFEYEIGNDTRSSFFIKKKWRKSKSQL